MAVEATQRHGVLTKQMPRGTAIGSWQEQAVGGGLSWTRVLKALSYVRQRTFFVLAQQILQLFRQRTTEAGPPNSGKQRGADHKRTSRAPRAALGATGTFSPIVGTAFSAQKQSKVCNTLMHKKSICSSYSSVGRISGCRAKELKLHHMPKPSMLEFVHVLVGECQFTCVWPLCRTTTTRNCCVSLPMSCYVVAGSLPNRCELHVTESTGELSFLCSPRAAALAAHHLIAFSTPGPGEP